MAEPRRIDDEFATADVAGRVPKSRDADVRPSLLRNEPRVSSETGSLPASQMRDEALGPDYPNESSTLTGGQSASVARVEAVQFHQEANSSSDQPVLLFGESEVANYRSRWSSIQTAFVDEPRQAVEDADSLVKSLLKQLAEGFTKERDRLAKQWDRGDNVSTEDLRVALQRYRSFFDRLLNV